MPFLPAQPQAPRQSDAQAAKILAQHTVAMMTEQAEASAWLRKHGFDTSVVYQVQDPALIMDTAMSNGEHMHNTNKQAEIVKARWASAALIGDALSIAKARTDPRIREMVDRQIARAVGRPKEPIFVSCPGCCGKSFARRLSAGRRDCREDRELVERSDLKRMTTCEGSMLAGGRLKR